MLRTYLITIVLSCMTPSVVAADEYRVEERFSPELVNSLSAEIDRLVDEKGLPSISIAITWRDSLLWHGAFGYADPDSNRRADDRTLYNVGSTFKLVTASAVMQLMERSLLDLDDPVCDYLDERPAAIGCGGEDRITFRHLLCHYSGLAGPTRTTDPWAGSAAPPLEDVYSHISTEASPEKEFLYCNECYAVLGLLVARISGLSFEEYIVRNILRPLGGRTINPITPSVYDQERIAAPYSFMNGRTERLAPIRYFAYPAGDAYMTAIDMALFLGAQLNGGISGDAEILSDRSVRLLRTPQYENREYAMGIGVSMKDGRTCIHHSGGTPGYSSLMFGEVESGIGLFIVTNAGGREAINAIFAPAITVFNELRGKTP